MKVYSKIDELKGALAGSKSIGLVPTMGYLHEGHLSLVRRAKGENAVTVVSIFVNPMQFAPNEDLDKYPRDLERDEALLRAEGVDYLFCPTPEEIYPEGFCTKISLTGLTETLCGASRPGHFDGVATVVTKLLSIVQPSTAYFGLKDYQQYLVINRFVKDLNLPYKICGVPIVREADGLALSSRNVYLKPTEREAALSLSRSFAIVQRAKDEGKSVDTAIEEVVRFISSHGENVVDYVEFVDPERLTPATTLTKPFMCMLAVKVGATRLIDNKLFN
ncbi:MAG: pantoate--beta-alanine ligase [Deferribacteraceae bacterium]|jgi:pantoate--beta-alanine ligase|nr:pantoate--beta-alanine ligase [Deferribacteraceae bacterium]